MKGWSQRSAAWTPPGEWARVRVVDAHTAGEPLRVILDGFPRPAGATVSQLRVDAAARHRNVIFGGFIVLIAALLLSNVVTMNRGDGTGRVSIDTYRWRCRAACAVITSI